MRGIMVSLVVLFFTMSIHIVNHVEDAHWDETNRTMYGFKTNKTLLIDGVAQDRDSLEAMIEPKEQPTGLLDSLLSSLVYVVKAGRFIMNVMWDATFGFGTFIQDFGFKNADGTSQFTIIPWYIAQFVGVAVNLNHALTILQIMSGRNMKEGL